MVPEEKKQEEQLEEVRFSATQLLQTCYVLTEVVSTGKGRDEKDTLISAPSIQMGALVGLGWVGFHPRTRLLGWWAGW
jgi:hypothetical protein